MFLEDYSVIRMLDGLRDQQKMANHRLAMGNAI